MLTNYHHMPYCVKIENGDVTTPKGFAACGIHSGLRKHKEDVGMILSDVPAVSAAVYTLNTFAAAPIVVTKESIQTTGELQAVIVNSACANACTGQLGLDNAYLTREAVAKKFRLAEHLVAVASTGVIGEQLKMNKLLPGIQFLTPSKTKTGAQSFQQAILTTDTCTKSTCYETRIDGKEVIIAGAAKGSGMIHPNMATMLGFITTDAVIDAVSLKQALKEVTDLSFNQITVDGETSTNDMVLIMANGKANHQPLSPYHPDWSKFMHALKRVCEDLAKSIARDGEGATKLIEVNVTGAKTAEDAQIIAKKIVGSSLVKTAAFGEDANWGRIIGAMGHSGVELNTANIDIYLGDHLVLQQSAPYPFVEEWVRAYLKGENVVILVDLHQGTEKGTAWGCDLSYDYVRINASYRT